MKTDEEVYNKLVKEKCNGYRNTITVLAVVCVLLLCATIVFMCLYFSRGTMVKHTNIEVITDGGDIDSSIINGNGNTISGTIEVFDDSVVKVAAIIGAVFLVSVVVIVWLIRSTKK